MRYCATCGEPVPEHVRRRVPADVRKAITDSARTVHELRTKLATAARICPVERTRRGWRSHRLAEVQTGA